MSALLVPATPLLLTGIDPGEPAAMRHLRALVHDALRTVEDPVLLVDSSSPSVLGLGGIGIDRGVRRADLAVLEGEAYRTAIAREVPVTTSGDHAAAVVLLACVEAGVAPRLVPVGADGAEAEHALGASATVIVPLDLSAATHPDGPLAAVAGADGAEQRFLAALAGGTPEDVRTVAAGDLPASDLTHLRRWCAVRAPRSWTARCLGGTDVHHVRYRVYTLDPAPDARTGTGSGARTGRRVRS
ncbi:hypothetical protein [Brevibacterium samyangense]|uniref:hypothetical protein n=1 Tax=Brevibacterium samyangense TaxID=366888 RepID=UPI0031D7927E